MCKDKNSKGERRCYGYFGSRCEPDLARCEQEQHDNDGGDEAKPTTTNVHHVTKTLPERTTAATKLTTAKPAGEKGCAGGCFCTIDMVQFVKKVCVQGCQRTGPYMVCPLELEKEDVPTVRPTVRPTLAAVWKCPFTSKSACIEIKSACSSSSSSSSGVLEDGAVTAPMVATACCRAVTTVCTRANGASAGYPAGAWDVPTYLDPRPTENVCANGELKELCDGGNGGGAALTTATTQPKITAKITSISPMTQREDDGGNGGGDTVRRPCDGDGKFDPRCLCEKSSARLRIVDTGKGGYTCVNPAKHCSAFTFGKAAPDCVCGSDENRVVLRAPGASAINHACMCCTGSNAECLACRADVSVGAFCASWASGPNDVADDGNVKVPFRCSSSISSSSKTTVATSTTMLTPTVPTSIKVPLTEGVPGANTASDTASGTNSSSAVDDSGVTLDDINDAGGTDDFSSSSSSSDSDSNSDNNMLNANGAESKNTGVVVGVIVSLLVVIGIAIGIYVVRGQGGSGAEAAARNRIPTQTDLRSIDNAVYEQPPSAARMVVHGGFAVPMDAETSA